MERSDIAGRRQPEGQGRWHWQPTRGSMMRSLRDFCECQFPEISCWALEFLQDLQSFGCVFGFRNQSLLLQRVQIPQPMSRIATVITLPRIIGQVAQCWPQTIGNIFHGIPDDGRGLPSHISGDRPKKACFETKCSERKHRQPDKNTPKLGGKPMAREGSKKVDETNRSKHGSRWKKDQSRSAEDVPESGITRFVWRLHEVVSILFIANFQLSPPVRRAPPGRSGTRFRGCPCAQEAPRA